MTTWESIRFDDLGVLKERFGVLQNWLGDLIGLTQSLRVWCRDYNVDSIEFDDLGVYNGWLESLCGLTIDKFVEVDLEVSSERLGNRRVWWFEGLQCLTLISTRNDLTVCGFNDVKPKEGIEKREEKGRTRKNRGRTGDTHGQARSCVTTRKTALGYN